MEHRLIGLDWFIGAAPTIADIAFYAYNHVADEGGFDLSKYPAVQYGLAKMGSLDGHVPLVPGQ
jgi:glutathione S-transferase